MWKGQIRSNIIFSSPIYMQIIKKWIELFKTLITNLSYSLLLSILYSLRKNTIRKFNKILSFNFCYFQCFCMSKKASYIVKRIQTREDIPDGLDLRLIAQKLLQVARARQLLLDLLGARQMVVDVRGLDRHRDLHHEPCVPFQGGRVLVRVVTQIHDSESEIMQ